MNQIISQRVTAIRAWLEHNNYDAFIIPHEDEFLGEYLPAHNERLSWASGFTGSAGAAVISKTDAAIFVDGRYTVQVTQQAPAELFEYCHLINQPPVEWLNKNLVENARVAFDPKMHSGAWLHRIQSALNSNLELVPVDANPIDALWQDRPQAVLSDVRLMDICYTGCSSVQKRQQVASALAQQGADAAVLTQLDSICWLLNLRGADVSRLPVVLSHAIIYADNSVDFFIDPSRLPSDFSAHVGAGVTVYQPIQLTERLAALSTKKVILDQAGSSAWFSMQLRDNNATIIDTSDPCMLPKAQKNPTELSGMQACHRRDGAAMAKFLCWLDNEVAAHRLHDEGVLADQLEQFRREDPSLADLSFDTISAASTNAAMCHYNHLNQAAPSKLTPDSLYLVDSGGQYPDGTTDITRTVAVGTPSSEMKRQFTLVLKGHIALANARFPSGTSGHQLDVLARQFLWSQGYDYDHGTGHGVGHFLNVHEGPQRIAKVPNSVALLPGMVLSNEPGYYREGQFGIRIENLEQVVAIETDGDFDVLGFASLTRCPIDARCIDRMLLNQQEIDWLNSYHQQVWQDVSPLVSGETKAWLQRATEQLV